MDRTRCRDRASAELGLGLPGSFERRIQEAAICARPDSRQQRLQRRRDVAHRRDIDRMSATEMRAVDVNLNDRRLPRIELPPGEIAAEQQQRVALGQRVIAALRAEDTRHPYVVGVVVLQKILGSRRAGDRCLEPFGKRDHLVVGMGAT